LYTLTLSSNNQQRTLYENYLSIPFSFPAKNDGAEKDETLLYIVIGSVFGVLVLFVLLAILVVFLRARRRIISITDPIALKNTKMGNRENQKEIEDQDDDLKKRIIHVKGYDNNSLVKETGN